MNEAVITRFDSQNPCWTKELLLLAGEDASELSSLNEKGLLFFEDGIYSLTENGVAVFNRLKAEFFLEGEAGTPNPEIGRKQSTMRTKLALLLDMSHTQRWGIKDIKTALNLPFVPKIDEDKIVSLCEGKVRWEYSDNFLYKKLVEEFPIVFIDERRTDMVPQENIDKWMKDNGAETDYLKTDVIYLCHYDFMHYRDFTGHPNDPLKLINTDRFLFVFPKESMLDNLEVVGKFHLWQNSLRRLYIPGYVDRDTLEQDSVNWLVFVTERDEEAKILAESLEAFGKDLIANANPCEVWTLSFEALENLKSKRELVWELLPDIGHYAQRTLV